MDGQAHADRGEETKRVMMDLGDYAVLRLIGEGGMGKVYEGEERLSKRKVALKVLRPELAKSAEGRRLFLNEMRILAHLEHPNIVRSLASLDANGELVMVLELLDGKTLREVLTDKGRLSWMSTVGHGSAIAGALSAAHGQVPAIVHRDLKPENVMVMTAGGLKVMDFGVAKVLAELQKATTQSVGTLQYMSPEQIDARAIDHRTDLYALGLVLYEMLEGKAPFVSASPRELLNMQCTAEPPPLSDEVREGLPKGIEDLIFQLLEKAPEDRPSSAEEVIERLAPFQSAGGGTTKVTRSAAAITTPVRDTKRDEPAAEKLADRASENADEKAEGAEKKAERKAESKDQPARLDTVALVERASAPRDVSTLGAIALIVALSIIAGIITYFVMPRASDEAPQTGATASATAPPRSGEGRR